MDFHEDFEGNDLMNHQGYVIFLKNDHYDNVILAIPVCVCVCVCKILLGIPNGLTKLSNSAKGRLVNPKLRKNTARRRSPLFFRGLTMSIGLKGKRSAVLHDLTTLILPGFAPFQTSSCLKKPFFWINFWPYFLRPWTFHCWRVEIATRFEQK